MRDALLDTEKRLAKAVKSPPTPTERGDDIHTLRLRLKDVDRRKKALLEAPRTSTKYAEHAKRYASEENAILSLIATLETSSTRDGL